MGRDALREYVRGSLWVLPGLSVLAALAVGAVLSSVRVGARSPLAFQGTPDDARTLLLGITGTMITIIALLLGLAVVALQLSSTQFSPRLLRNFLRDRPNQVVLSAFVATFAYSAAGLYTVGVSGGDRTAAFPRLAVSGAIVLLFASLGLLVFFADHLLHSIQVDAIMETVQRNTLAVIEDGLLTGGQQAPEVPAWAVPVPSRHSGYVQTVRPRALLPCAARHGVCLRLRPRVGEHVVAGTTLAWIWRASPEDPAPDPAVFARILDSGVRIGFERTVEQDAAFGIRQLVDVACKALSPPATASRDRPGPAVRRPRGDVRAAAGPARPSPTRCAHAWRAVAETIPIRAPINVPFSLHARTCSRGAQPHSFAGGRGAVPPNPAEMAPAGMIRLPTASVTASTFRPEESSSTTMV